MLELDMIKGFNQSRCNSSISQEGNLPHSKFSIDLFDNELGVCLHSESANYHLQNRDEPYDQSFILDFIVLAKEFELENERDVVAREVRLLFQR